MDTIHHGDDDVHRVTSAGERQILQETRGQIDRSAQRMMSRTSSSEARQEVARIVEDGAVGTEAIA
jgi:hypothetical protein